MVHKITAIPMPAQVTEDVIKQLADVGFTKFKACAAFRSAQCVGQPLQVLLLVHPAGAYIAKKLTRSLCKVQEGSLKPQCMRCPLTRFLHQCQSFSLLYDGIVQKKAQINGMTAVIPCYSPSSLPQIYKRFPRSSFVPLRGDYHTIEDALAQISPHSTELDSESDIESDHEGDLDQNSIDSQYVPVSENINANTQQLSDSSDELQQLRMQLEAAKQEAADNKAGADQLAAECEQLRSQLAAAQQHADDSDITIEQLRDQLAELKHEANQHVVSLQRILGYHGAK